ncbi:hypothetical protein AVEN_255937-1 [Araneus ventricosus]|uniref:Uncharacterized protein n=1 Tax=Araneus ventricosus TaxID=182803 RepID=A0A4Y2KLP1_ARAVE|nr:hypothetical protein AVEN_255937-1 [Araneus ventricosus]
MIIVSYPYLNSFHEDLFLPKPLPTATTDTEIFKLLDEFFAESSILWDNYINVCTDEAKGMTGKTPGAIAKIEKPRGAAVANAYFIDMLLQ